MLTQHTFSLLMTCILLTGCAAPRGVPNTPAPVFAVAADGDGNEVTASAEGETVVIDVHSQSGMGSAHVEHVSGALPESIVVRLYLKGLEEFRLSYDGTTITASVSSGDSHNVFQSAAGPEAGERPITPGSPYWMDVRIVTDQETPHIPLDQGYFEVALPKDFLQEGRRSFSIRWIDFYR